MNLCQLFGFACFIPIGQFWLDYIFNKPISLNSFLLSSFSGLLGGLILLIGGIISSNGKD